MNISVGETPSFRGSSTPKLLKWTRQTLLKLKNKLFKGVCQGKCWPLYGRGKLKVLVISIGAISTKGYDLAKGCLLLSRNINNIKLELTLGSQVKVTLCRKTCLYLGINKGGGRLEIEILFYLRTSWCVSSISSDRG